jgi:threonine/homoserine/homoserine lactone efflux protein
MRDDDKDDPMSLDEDEPRRTKKKRARNREDESDSSSSAVVIGASVFLFYVKMIFFAVGFALAFIAIDQDTPNRTIGFFGLAIFCLIASRLAQAEEHRLRDKNR